jgi:gas vesicle protein
VASPINNRTATIIGLAVAGVVVGAVATLLIKRKR